MKNLLIIFVILCSATYYSQAQTKSEDIKKLLTLMGAEKTINETMNSAMQMMKQQAETQFKSKNKQKQYDKFVQFLSEKMKGLTIKLVDQEMAGLYDKHFNESEIKELITFYESSVGKKTIETIPALTKDLMTIMSTKYAPQFQKDIMNKMEELLK